MDTDRMADNLDLVRGTLDLFVLKTLISGPRQGPMILRWIETVTQAQLRVEEGGAYPALHRIEQKGWFAADWGLSGNNRRASAHAQGTSPVHRDALALATLRQRRLPHIGRFAVVRDDFPRMGLRDTALSPLEALDLFERKDLFCSATSVGGERTTIEIDGEPSHTSGAPTVGDFFGAFVVRPVLGRTSRPEDSEMGRPRVVVLNHRLSSQLTSGSAVIGTAPRTRETPYEVIGDLPASFGYRRSG